MEDASGLQPDPPRRDQAGELADPDGEALPHCSDAFETLETTMTKTTTSASTRTATAATEGNALGHYKAILAGWPTKFAGPKPTSANFAFAHSLGARPGTKTAVALAMYARDNGASQAQVINVNGGPYLNKMRAVIEAGHASRMPVPANAQGHTVYRLALPVKAKAKAKATKPRKAKADKPAEQATS